MKKSLFFVFPLLIYYWFIVIAIYKMIIDGNFKLTSNRKSSPDSFRRRIQFCRRSFLLFNECALTLPCLDLLWWVTFFEGGVALELTDVPRSKWFNLSLSTFIFGSTVCSFIGSSSFTFGRTIPCTQCNLWVRRSWRFRRPWIFCISINMRDD